MQITDKLLVPQSQVKQWHNFHSEEDTKIWVDKLPMVVEDLINRWQLELHQIMHAGVEGLVIKASIGDKKLVLKIMISSRDCNRQIRILELLTIAHIRLAVPLLGHYRAGHALLMPYVIGKHPLASPKTDIKLRDCLTELHTSGLKGVRSLSSHWTRRVDRTRARSSKFPLNSDKEKLILQANKLGLKLAKEKHRNLLHGDIHPQNMILNKDGLTLMDFRGLAGDPAFDFANWTARTCLDGGFERKLSDRERTWFLAHLPAEAQLLELNGNLKGSDLIWEYLFDNKNELH